MEKLIQYQHAILRALQAHEYVSGNVTSSIIADAERGHFQLALIGQDKRHTSFIWIRIHLQLKPDGKIWILENKTEYDIGEELVAEGVPKSDIVIGILPEDVRKYTEYAVY